MTWIKTIPFDEADETLRKALRGAARALPEGVREPTSRRTTTSEGIVATHTLIPEALHHAFATFGALMSPDLPLTRRAARDDHDVVSATQPLPLLTGVSRRVSASRDAGRGARRGAGRRTIGTRRISEQDRVMLDYVEQLTKDATRVTPATTSGCARPASTTAASCRSR